MNGVGPLSAVEAQIRAAAEEESRRRLAHGAPLPDIGPVFQQALIRGAASVPEFFLSGSITPYAMPLSETPLQDYLRSTGVLTERGEPVDAPGRAAATAGEWLGGLAAGGINPASVVRGGARVAGRLGTALSEAGTGVSPLMRQRGALSLVGGKPQSSIEELNAAADAAYQRYIAAPHGSPQKRVFYAEWQARNAEVAQLFTRSLARTEFEASMRERNSPLGGVGPFRGQRGAIGPLDEYIGGLKREAGTRLPTLEEQLASVRRRMAEDPEALARAQAERQAAEQQTSARLAQERAARGAAPAPQAQPALATARLLGDERTIPIELRRAADGRYRWYDSETGKDINLHGRTPEEALDDARREWGRGFQTGTPQAQAPLATARIDYKTGMRTPIELRQEADGTYRWYNSTTGERVGAYGTTPEEAHQRAAARWSGFNPHATSPALANIDQKLADARGMLKDITERQGSTEAISAASRRVGALEARRAEVAEPARGATRGQLANVERLFSQGIAKRPESFQFGGAPESANIDDIVAHYSSAKVPLEAGPDPYYPSNIQIRNKETGGYLTIKNADSPTPYISSPEAESAGKEMGGGKQMYQAAMSWITNQGKRLAPDPRGISTINVLRKLSNTLSSYYRHGKSGYIDLSNVTEAKSVQQMQVAEMEHVFSARNDLGQNLIFNGEQFTNLAGTVLSDKTLQAMIKARDPQFRQGIGVATLKRAAMTRWAMQASKEDVIEAAKRFKDPVLYGLAGLFALKQKPPASEGD